MVQMYMCKLVYEKDYMQITVDKMAGKCGYS